MYYNASDESSVRLFKALQKDEDGAAAIKQAQGSSGGRLQAEARLAKSWIDEKNVLIEGELHFSNGNSRGLSLHPRIYRSAGQTR